MAYNYNTNKDEKIVANGPCSLSGFFINLEEDIQNKKELTIGTHPGVFHPDDVCSKAVTDEYKNQENPNLNIHWIRSRDLNVLNKCDYLFDVGGSFDERVHDHHQPDAPVRVDGQKLSSFGQLWHSGIGLMFVQNIVEKYLPDTNDNRKEIYDITDNVWKQFDQMFVKAIDRKDNGAKDFKVGEIVDFCSIISLFNSFEDPFDHKNDLNFETACNFARKIILMIITNMARTEIGKLKMKEYLESAEKFGNKIAFIPKGLGAWKSVLTEETYPQFKNLRAVLTQAEKGVYGLTGWPDKAGFTMGLKWRLTPAVKEKHGMIFVHVNGFYGTFHAENQMEALVKASAIAEDMEKVEP